MSGILYFLILTILFSNIKDFILIISSFIAKDEQAEKEREEVFLSSFKEFWKSLDSVAIQPDKKDVLVNIAALHCIKEIIKINYNYIYIYSTAYMKLDLMKRARSEHKLLYRISY